jgi:glycosyltransferase involved in cell wall biosynthesis
MQHVKQLPYFAEVNMRIEKSVPALLKPQILLIFPLIYRPQKDNVAKRFELLSQWYRGHIFALSGGRQRNIVVSDFLFHSESSEGGAAKKILRGLWIQVILPLRLLWGKSRVSAVIAYDPFRSGLNALILKYLLRCKLIIEVNGEFQGDYEKNEPGQNIFSVLLRNLLLKLTLRCSDGIRVLNVDQEKYYRRLFPTKHFYRFPDFVATEYFESLVCSQGNYLLSVGQPFHRKGVDILIEAFKRVADSHPNASLRIMGYCPEGDLARYQALTGGHPRISFIKPGWIEEVGEQMSGCYALVNAARSEAMGRIHIEAMACSKPIIATRTNGALECIEDGQTGLLCAIDDVNELADKLNELLSHPDRALQMGRAGKLRMKTMFSENVSIESYHAMVEEVTGKSDAS